MLLRSRRLMPQSPKRVFSTAKSALLNALDRALSSSEGSAEDPFGSEWPPKESAAPQPLHNTGTKLAQWPPSRSKASGTTTADSATTSKTSLKSSMTQTLPFVPSNDTSRPKAVSRHSKENGVVQPAPKVVLDPPLVHPLPMYSYKDYKPSPTRVYVRHEEKADDLIRTLSGPVGFDIEWKVIFRRGERMRPAATVQLSDRRMILVIQVTAMEGFPKKLKELLENPKIAKVGVNILNDGKKLARDYGVRAQGLVELGYLAKVADGLYLERYFRASEATNGSSSSEDTAPKVRKPGAIITLAIVTAMYTGRALPKGPVRISDWEAQPLSETQLEYAANDAHSALMVYDCLIAIAKAANVVLEPPKYTAGVEKHYGLSFGAKSAPAPAKSTLFKPAPLFRAPALATKTPSSSTSTSTTTSAYTASSSSSTTTSSASVHFPSSHVAMVDHAQSQIKSRKAISSAAYAEMSDDDVEVFEVRVHREHNRTTSQMGKPLSTTGASGTTSSSEPIPRGRPGPRFKPSYDILPTTNASRSSSPTKPTQMKEARTLLPNNASPERSPRFKPSYNTTVSRSPSPVKLSAIMERPTSPLSKSSSPSQMPASLPQPTNQRAQHIRAYNLWHLRQLPLSEICSVLRSCDNPLKASTVITYVITALQTDPTLHFSHERLRALLSSDPKSWLYYRDWFHTLNITKYVNMDVGNGRQGKDKRLD